MLVNRERRSSLGTLALHAAANTLMAVGSLSASAQETTEPASSPQVSQEIVVTGMTEYTVEELMKLLDNAIFDTRQKATAECINRGMASFKDTGTLPSWVSVLPATIEDTLYSKERRGRSKYILDLLHAVELKPLWDGTKLRVPEGWKKDETKPAKEILHALRQGGSTDIHTESATEKFLAVPCRVPEDGTSFWDVYRSLHKQSDATCTINCMSVGVLYLGAPQYNEALASDGSLLGTLRNTSVGRAILFLHMEGNLQLRSWRCLEATAHFADGGRERLTLDSVSGTWDDALYLNLPKMQEGRETADIEVKLHCRAWPIERCVVTDFRTPERQGTADGSLRFLRLEETWVSNSPLKGSSKIYIVHAIDYRGFPKPADGKLPYPNRVHDIEVYGKNGEPIPFCEELYNENAPTMAYAFPEEPSTVILRSIGLKRSSNANRELTFPSFSLR